MMPPTAQRWLANRLACYHGLRTLLSGTSMALRGLLRRLPRQQARPTDKQVANWIISYPKSGRTWLRVLLGRVLSRHYGLSDDLLFDEKALFAQAGLPVTDFSHDGTSNSEGRHWQALESDKAAFAGSRVLLLVRDPRDVVVSCYFQATRRKARFSGDLGGFVRSDTHGIRKIVRFFTIWDRNRSTPAGFMALRYEDLRADPAPLVREALAFLGVDGIPGSVIDEAVEFSSFDRMQEMERSDSLKNKKLRAGDTNDPESFKVRRGKVGGYVDYLDSDDIEYCRQIMIEMNCPFGYAGDPVEQDNLGLS